MILLQNSTSRLPRFIQLHYIGDYHGLSGFPEDAHLIKSPNNDKSLLRYTQKSVETK